MSFFSLSFLSTAVEGESASLSCVGSCVVVTVDDLEVSAESASDFLLEGSVGGGGGGIGGGGVRAFGCCCGCFVVGRGNGFVSGVRVSVLTPRC